MPELRERNPLQHCFDILEIISSSGEPLAMSAIAEALHVHRSTASRLLATLTERGMTARDAVTLRYRLGPGLIALAGAALERNLLAEIARPVLEEVARETREAVALSVWNKDCAVDIAVEPGLELITFSPTLGMRNPAFCTATGRVFLARLPAADRARILGRKLTPYTPATIVDRQALEAALDEVRRTGVAIAIDEFMENLCAVGVPVGKCDEMPVAALVVAVPTFRFSNGKRKCCIDALKRGAAAIAARGLPGG